MSCLIFFGRITMASWNVDVKKSPSSFVPAKQYQSMFYDQNYGLTTASQPIINIFKTCWHNKSNHFTDATSKLLRFGFITHQLCYGDARGCVRDVCKRWRRHSQPLVDWLSSVYDVAIGDPSSCYHMTAFWKIISTWNQVKSHICDWLRFTSLLILTLQWSSGWTLCLGLIMSKLSNKWYH